jgi:hypothetical protein
MFVSSDVLDWIKGRAERNDRGADGAP